MNKYGWRSGVSVLCLIGVAACGGSGNGGAATVGASSTVVERSGVFVDGLVAGLQYRTLTRSGYTDTSGAFSYASGEVMTFHIGSLTLGEAVGAALLTPVQLVPGATDVNHPRVTNLAMLLQSLDADNNLANGIRIPALAATTNASAIDFTLAPDDFAASNAVRDYIRTATGDTTRTVIAPTQARSNLQKGIDGSANGNRPPVANAGTDRAVDEAAAVSITGQGNDPESGTLDYQWTRVSGPAVTLSNANTATVSFTAPSVAQQTLLTLRLVVSDPQQATASDDVVITIRDTGNNNTNTPPTAHAGPDQTVTEGTVVALDGRASSDAEDGTTLAYVWTQTAGPDVTLNNASSAQPSFTAPQVSTQSVLAFQLTVRDSQQAQAMDTVQVTVNDVPPPPPPPAFDLCEPLTNTYCLSQIPVIGPALLSVLESLLDSGTPPVASGTWLKGDLHVHDDHSSDGSLPRQTLGQGSPGNTSVGDQILWAETMGLDFLPLNDHRTFDQHYDPLWKSDKLILITGEEANSRPHATVFGAVDMINQAENPAGAPEFRKLQQSIWDAHLQGAVWGTAHPDDGEVQTLNPDGSITPNNYALATGPDLVEIWNRGTLNRPKIAYCENRWNAGYRFGIAGASDDHFKELWPIAGPGQPTTHVLATEKNAQALIEALRAGRTAINLNAAAPFVTLTGDFQNDGQFEVVGGDEAKLPAGSAAKLRVSIKNGIGATVRVYRMPGMSAGVFKTFQPTQPDQTFDFEISAEAAKPQDWYRVEVRGPGDPDAADYSAFLDGRPQDVLDPDYANQLRAVTAPIFVYTQQPALPSTELPADIGVTDSAQWLMGSDRDGAFAGFADVAESAATVHVVAEVQGDGASRVMYRRQSNGVLSEPVDLAPASRAARQPQIAAAGLDVWVVWQDGRFGETPHRRQIMLRHSVDGGQTWLAEQMVSASAARAEHPDLALINPGMPVVVWQDNTGGAFDVLARVIGRDAAPVNLSATGKTVSAGNAYDTRSPRHPASVHPRVAVRNSDGLIAVGWQDNRKDVDAGWTGHATQNPQDEEGTETDDWEIFVATRAAASAGWSAPGNVSESSTLADRHTTLAFDTTGLLHAAWDSKTLDPAGPRLAIHTRRSLSAANLMQWTPVEAIALKPEFSSQRPVFGRNGDALSLFWMDGRSADWRWRVLRSDFSGAGVWGAAQTVTGRGNAAWPSFANGALVFTSDRNATREQRKPQQVFVLQLETARTAAVLAGDAAHNNGPAAFDLCDPIMGQYCLSQVPTLGPVLLGLLQPVLGGGGAPDLGALGQGCRAAGGPDSVCDALAGQSRPSGLSRYVDPRIGSYPPGFTNPGPVLPFGMVALGPDTEGPLNYGGYSVQNSLITGFSHVHMSAGVFKAGQFPVLPFTGELTPGNLSQTGYPGQAPSYASPYERASEVAQAGYYSALLTRYGVLAELTATERVGLHRYSFHNPAQPPRIVIDASRTGDGYRAASVRLYPDGTLTGKVRNNDAGGFDIYFAARVNRPFTAVRTLSGEAITTGQVKTGSDLGVILDFAQADSVVLLKLALSYTDEQGAINNLDAELPGWDFDATRAAARDQWDQALSRIVVEGGTEGERTSFYTALYRMAHFPNLHSDVDGRYRGPDNQIHQDERPHYSQFSSWDSYRGQNAMQAEIFPDRYRDMLRSLLDFSVQNGGILPRWQQGPKDASHMSGDPIIPFIGEAWCRGQINQDLRASLWPALLKLPSVRDPQLAQLGYLAVPEPSTAELIEGGPGRTGTTLEYGIADFSLALMAQSAAAADAAAIGQRSLNYRNLLDTEDTKWIRPKRADGQFIETFRPELGYGFQEGTSWQYSWLAQHDYAGLILRMGGDNAVDQRLDQFFNFPVAQVPLAWPTIQNQITAFGVAYYGNQYAPGNEHDLQAPYVYNYSGAPWKTQAVARAAASIYTPTATGLPGNDDLGALSGWLLWTMMGVYPVNPGTPLLVVGSPHFEKVTLKRPSGDLVIEAPGASAINRFVTGLSINGQAQDRSWFVLPQTATTVRLTTAAAPDMTWAAKLASRPPSLSTHALSAFGCTTSADAPVMESGFDAGGEPLASGVVPLCESFGPQLQPLCSAYETGASQLVQQCRSMPGQSAASCSVLGGHPHGIIEFCRENGGGPLCKVADTFLEGMASLCRQIPQAPADFCAVPGHQRIAQDEVVRFEQSWTHRALQLQYEIGAPLRLVDSLWPATHNTFNAADSNTPPTPSGLDSNQRYSSVDQLRMGIRALELDVHWMPQPTRGGFAPTVCHGNQEHVGCTLERPLATELAEIRDWMKINPDQVLVLYLENNLNQPTDAPSGQVTMNEPYAAAASVVRKAFGDLLYTPADHALALGAPFTCSSGHPLKASIQSLRERGKRVLIHTEGCNAGWAPLVFNKEAGNTHNQGPDESQLQTFSADGMCGGFMRSEHQKKWTRYFEDGTMVGALTSQSDTQLASPDDLRGMVRCGVNMPSMDHVIPNDPRLAAYVWSWEPGQPVANKTLNCALHTAAARFRAADCAVENLHACVRYSDVANTPSQKTEWAISAAAGAGTSAVCPAGYQFGTPRNGYENELLGLAKSAVGLSEVWLNYSDAAKEGSWRTGPLP